MYGTKQAISNLELWPCLISYHVRSMVAFTLANPDGGQGVQLSPGKSQMVIDFQKEYEYEAPSRGRSYLNYLMTYIKRGIQHLFY